MNPSDGALIAAAGVFLLLGLTAVLVVETYLLSERHKPITTYVRNAVLIWPGRTLGAIAIIVFSVGLLYAHFVWDAGCG